MILSLSYYDMPSHLRTCFLYLSVFPEDYMINKVCLINMWIAEGFIQSGKQGQTLLEVGESCFNDLINRSMIQPMYDWYSGSIQGCRVHDMGLDLICSLSNEENFVTILNSTENTSPSNTIRRLSLQNGKDNHSRTWATKSLQQVRLLYLYFHLFLIQCQPLIVSELHVYWTCKVAIFHRVTALSTLGNYFT